MNVNNYPNHHQRAFMTRHLSFNSLANKMSDYSFNPSYSYEWELCGHS